MTVIDVPRRIFQEQPDFTAANHDVYELPIIPEELSGIFDSKSFSLDSKPTKLFHGNIEMGADAVKWTLEIPEDIIYEGIAIFSPGYLAIKQSSRSIRHALAQQGISALTYSPARRDGESWWVSAEDPQKIHAETQRAIGKDLRQRSDIKNSAPNSSRIDLNRKILIAHSMGGLAATRFAQMEPGNIEMIVGLAACGFGHPTLAELATDIPGGILNSLKHELIPAIQRGNIAVNLRNIKDLINYYTHMRVAFEGISCVFDDVREDVAKLDDKGIPYFYEAYQHDILVRPDKSVAKYVRSHEIVANAGHLQPQKRPERVAHRIGKLVQAHT
jgi:hypothetical protein